MSKKAFAASILMAVCLQAATPTFASDDWGYEQPLLGHPGLTYRLHCENCNVKGPHMWWVEFHNTTPAKVAFSFHVAMAGLDHVPFSDRLVIDPGKTARGWNTVNNDDVYMTPTVYTANLKSGPDAD